MRLFSRRPFSGERVFQISTCHAVTLQALLKTVRMDVWCYFSFTCVSPRKMPNPLFESITNVWACSSPSKQWRTEVRWRPGQETSLPPPCLNLKSFGSKCAVLKKVPATLLGLFGSDSAPGAVCPPFPLPPTYRWLLKRECDSTQNFRKNYAV